MPLAAVIPTITMADHRHRNMYTRRIAFAIVLLFTVSVLLSSLQNTTIINFQSVNNKDHDNYDSSYRSNSSGLPMPYTISNTTDIQQYSIIDTSLNNIRRLQTTTTTTCPPLSPPQLSPPPHSTSLPSQLLAKALHKSTYAVSFPGSGDKLITKYYIQYITGLNVGEASISPSYEKLEQIRLINARIAEKNSNNGGENGEGSGIDGEGSNWKEEGSEEEEVYDGEGGLMSGEARGQGEVVAVRTSFPHTSGKLASWDDDITRAFVLLRNPLHALPCYFDRLYEIRNHLPTGSSSLPQHSTDIKNQWLKWRDNQLHSQLMLYRRFVSFWMEKFLNNDDARMYFAYEDFVNGEKGIDEAVRLYNFMEEGIRGSVLDWVMTGMEDMKRKDNGQWKKKKIYDKDATQDELPLDAYLKEGLSPEEAIDKAVSEVTQSVVNVEDVPCIWKEVVYSTVSSSAATSSKEGSAIRQRNRIRHRRRKLQEEDTFDYLRRQPPSTAEDTTPKQPPVNNNNKIPHEEEGSNWNPTERPYTPENLASMSQMLLELMNRWSRHQRLLSILSKYHREVNRAYLDSTGKLDKALKDRDALDHVSSITRVKEQPTQAVVEGQEQQQVVQSQQSIQEQPLQDQETAQPQLPIPNEETQTKPLFNIIIASPINNDASIIATNWLMGLFQHEDDIAFMNAWPETSIQQSGHDVTTFDNIVMMTNSMDLLGMYKIIRPRVGEVMYVVTNRESDEMCGYKNCLCIETNELQYSNEDELRSMVISLTEKFKNRFEYFFGSTESPPISEVDEFHAVERLDAMAKVVFDMTNEPSDKVDLKYGVHGGGGGGGGKGVGIEKTQPVSDEDNESLPLVDDQHRRLSVALPNGECEVTWPQPPKRPFQTAYAASYPGCGARMSWNLIEALTGLWTGDDWDSNNRGKRVVTVKTHYPHHAGQLVEWDDEINRALVVIRNPMAAIPSFFNHIYEMKNHLPVHSERAPVADWIEWRDRLAKQQITKFGEFVDYWMERFDKSSKDRIFISYEVLTDDNAGPDETIRINNFLGQMEGVNPIKTEAVPCIWRTVIKYKQQLEPDQPEQQQQRRRLDVGRRRLDPSHHDSQRTGPTERPYTPELLQDMVTMLAGLIERWGERNQRLRGILEGYNTVVHAAYLDTLNQPAQTYTPAIPAPDISTAKSFHIFYATASGSTILNNLLAGLFDPEADFKKSSIVTRAADFDLLPLYKQEKPNYDEVLFVAVRDASASVPMDEQLCEYNNLLCIDSTELVFNNQEELQSVVTNVATKLQSRFEYFFGSNFLTESKRMDAVKRLESMDKAIAAVDGHEPIVGSQSNGSNKMVNGKTFHIFQASPESSISESLVAANWLMGLFEPEQDISFMNPDQTVVQHDMNVPVETTIVTKTNILDLMGLYKQYKPQFDEILFVASHGREERVDATLCDYDNVLCLESDELVFAVGGEWQVVRSLTAKFRSRFEYFFGKSSDLLSDDKAAAAVRRLEGMSQVSASSNQAPQISGGQGVKRQFYCGGPQEKRNQPNFKYSTFGLFLAQGLFPEYKGGITLDSNTKKVDVSAIPLTERTITDATSDDMLIMHSHQYCEVPVEQFPGIQLHINAEYYDIHPAHLDNIEGKLTWDYLPPGDRTYVIGPHMDTSRSIQVPYVSMRLWFLHTTGQVELRKVFDPFYRPKNTKENFMLYMNSHYIEYRERAARMIAEEIGTIHVGGKCQGNYEANPAQPADDSAIQCVPFDDSQRPPSIQPISGELGTDHMHHNRELFSQYRYALVMENSDSPGYISEKILAAFLSGTVPIYFGSRFVFEIFNPKAFIFFDLDVPHQALSQIRFCEQNPDEYRKMLNEPILLNGEETIDKYFSWDDTVGNGNLKARIRHMVGLSQLIV